MKESAHDLAVATPPVCVHLGNRFVVLHQESTLRLPFKLGVINEAGWSVYFNQHSVYVKHFPFAAGEAYPDFGANYESYMTDFMLEMGTLSPPAHVGTW